MPGGPGPRQGLRPPCTTPLPQSLSIFQISISLSLLFPLSCLLSFWISRNVRYSVPIIASLFLSVFFRFFVSQSVSLSLGSVSPCPSLLLLLFSFFPFFFLLFRYNFLPWIFLFLCHFRWITTTRFCFHQSPFVTKMTSEERVHLRREFTI